ncbi:MULTISPECIES: glucose-6-phosphate isomerase [unclassified Herbaspirillum]|uniref:glucose-6-phosphate isomerase n=1 Tax=unclassified Herbaspirillum TaxID=2624150 RepID=UPI000E2E61FF|nr:MULTISPECIES: glucose-6-phosphate isomerase [unclassified Herbaspirillum]RFB74125.1 glucose-6-phosphate isomerase [Herbaspirillum sp. 3R-3a1]TFI10057.1 glucose-6-phosphate isomerase [Herbaspirillum sp. 3R11]TFI15961.1 glucose-6-phosphate isomerase [Herbaspirillum sp. 3R-11]TFI18954.1 glucose-6-phosphate isomerase [Herbaspirillum sp. 3C11]
MPHTALTATAAFQALLSHHAEVRDRHMRDLFAADPERFDHMTVKAAGILFDYSKNRVDHTTLKLLFELARERGVERQRAAMFSGEKINFTEHRAVLHTALRAPRGQALQVDGQHIGEDVHAVLDRIHGFTERVREGQWLGLSGKPITDIVNIGIGGSHLGPQMACTALRTFAHPRLTMHFVSNVDGHDLHDVLQRVDVETTLFIVASKTFTTQETMMNAGSARDWFLQRAGAADLAKHFVAVSTNTEAVRAFGIDTDNMFPFWDWVGGRYSMWSSIGLSIALAIGFKNFSELLAGAHAMDKHFCEAPLEQNMPIIQALIGIWNRNCFNSESLSIAPYHHDLRHFPAYLQQLEMESNGKRITRDGSAVGVATCPFIWGDVGTNGQHAFFQLLHQGTDITPIDFIAVLHATHDLPGHHAVLLANCFAQSEAFMRGKQADEVREDLKKLGVDDDEVNFLLPHKTFNGNRPSNTLLLDVLTPATLGALIALYEHKTFVQGTIWGINSFDQWGVELGKVLAKTIQSELSGEAVPARHDCSTNALIALAKKALSDPRN